MPKFVRGYKKQDFSELLSELNGTQDKAKTEKSLTGRPSKEERTKASVVATASRRRASLMDDTKMLYAFSKKSQLFHDRDCEYVKRISDENFCMVGEFDTDKPWCPCCYRKALIRSSIGDDRRRIGAYERFFNRLNVSNRELKILLIENKAKMKWINNDVVQFSVKEDNWQVVCGPDGLELWHNNYISLDDCSRHFTKGFHRQNVYGPQTFYNFMNIMVSYSFKKHMGLV